MKKIAGAFTLLAGLVGISGCVTLHPHTTGQEKKAAEPRPLMSKVNVPPSLAPTSVPPPGQAMQYSQWTPDPMHRTGTMPGTMAGGHLASLQPVPNTPNPGLTRPPHDLPGLPPGMPMARTPQTFAEVPAPTIQQTKGSTGPVSAPEIITANKPATPVNLPVGSEPKETDKSREAKNTRSSQADKGGNGPLFRLVNSKQITLNFEVQDVGSSGLAGVDLWYTQDGKDWKKWAAPKQSRASIIEVDEEGVYGFTLVARSGIGLGQEPPASGDQPQVWVIVDLTPPEVQLSEPAFTPKSRDQKVALNWQASDKNLGRMPVSLSYAAAPNGPWKPIASNLPACGSHEWEVSDHLPPRVFIKVEATDMAGNVGKAVSGKPILLDSAMPQVRIRSVEGATGAERN